METRLKRATLSLATDFTSADEAWSVFSGDPSPMHWLFHPSEQAELNDGGLKLQARPWKEFEAAGVATKRDGDCFSVTPVSPEQRLMLLFRVVQGWYELGIWPVDYSCMVAAAKEGPLVIIEREPIARMTAKGDLELEPSVRGLICDALLIPPDFFSKPESRQMVALMNGASGPRTNEVNIDPKGALTFDA